jgi:Saxitoxin biosynthesis operon protein SxtJ
MITLGKRNFNLTESREISQARKTISLVAGVFALGAFWNIYRGRVPAASVFVSLAGILSLVALAVPPLAILFHRAWMRLAAALGYVNSRIILGILFVVVITPMAAIMRLLARDPLLRRGAPRDTYWVPRECTRQAAESFERAF